MKDEEKEKEKVINNTLPIEYKAILKTLREQKRIGLIGKSEYDYLRTTNLMNLTDK